MSKGVNCEGDVIPIIQIKPVFKVKKKHFWSKLVCNQLLPFSYKGYFQVIE